MNSNVVALPGIGSGPHVPARPAAPSSAPIKPGAESRADRQPFAAAEDSSQNQAEGKKSGPARPHSPVNLNSLLAAQEQGGAQENAPASTGAPAAAPEQGAGQAAQLSEGEREQVQELKKQDAEIHRHEQAHAAAGGQYAGAPQYGYTTGPDGQRYANSGHVAIDVSPVAGNPKATIEKMSVVQRAANAPAEPSGADRSVAARATAAKQTAQLELAKLNAQERSQPTGEDAAEAGPATDRVEGTAADKAEGFVAGFAFDSEQSKDKPPATAATAANGISHAAAAAAYAAPLNTITGASTI